MYLKLLVVLVSLDCPRLRNQTFENRYHAVTFVLVVLLLLEAIGHLYCFLFKFVSRKLVKAALPTGFESACYNYEYYIWNLHPFDDTTTFVIVLKFCF